MSFVECRREVKYYLVMFREKGEEILAVRPRYHQMGIDL